MIRSFSKQLGVFFSSGLRWVSRKIFDWNSVCRIGINRIYMQLSNSIRCAKMSLSHESYWYESDHKIFSHGIQFDQMFLIEKSRPTHFFVQFCYLYTIGFYNKDKTHSNCQKCAKILIMKVLYIFKNNILTKSLHHGDFFDVKTFSPMIQ